MTPTFVHLGARSEASRGESLARIDELCWEAARDQQGFLALTDRNSVARAPAFAVAAARSGLRPIFGAEINFLPYGETQFRGTTFPLRLLVENETGWRNLVRLVNRTQKAGVNQTPPYTSFAPLLEDARGLIFLIGGQDGEITALLNEGRYEKIEQIIEELAHAAGRDRLMIELPPPVGQGAVKAKALDAIAKHFNLMTVAIPTIRCAHPADDVVYRVYADDHNGQTDLATPGHPLRQYIRPMEQREYLARQEAVSELYAQYPDATEITLALAQHCSSFTLPQPPLRFPVHNFNRGVDAESYIWNNAFAKAAERYGDLPTRYKERLNREFREIVDSGLANAVVSMARLNEELDREGVQRGPGAGLLTTSVIASLLGLTRLDPLKFDLPFDLPTGLGQGSYPLLEISIPTNQETDAVKTLSRLLDDQVCHVGEWRTWKPNQCLDRLALLLGKDGRWSGSMTKNNVFTRQLKEMREQPVTWVPDPDALCESPEVLSWLVARMEGRLKNLVPAQGIYTFSVDAIESMIPGQPVGDGKHQMVSEWTSEELGRLRHGRIAFIHSRMLDLIGESTELVRQQGDFRYAPEQTTSDDAGTYRMLREGLTAGIPSMESPLIRQRLRQGQPSDLHTLIRLLTPKENDIQKDLLPDFSTILLCHVCASIKAHRPSAFYAAALTQASGDPRRMALLVDEARQRGLEISDLDINYSSWHWNIERDSLRPGFVAIRGMTKAAGEEIAKKRQELHFSDLADLCRRIEKGRIKELQLRNLIRAGAFDNMGNNRAEVMAQFEEIFPMIKSKKTSGNENDDELAFFDRDGSWWLQEYGTSANETRELLPGEDPRELLLQEMEACGVTLREYALPEKLYFLRAAQARIAEKLNLKASGHPITLFGRLGPINCIEHSAGETVYTDIGGCLIEAYGEVAEQLKAPELAGMEVLFTGPMERKPFQWCMKLHSIITVDEAMEQGARASRLSMDLSNIDENVQKNLLALLKQFPGRTPVKMDWMPVQPKRTFRSLTSKEILVCPLLELLLLNLLGDKNWEIEYNNTPHPLESRSMVELSAEFGSKTLKKIKGLLKTNNS